MRYFAALCLTLVLIGFVAPRAFGQGQSRGASRDPDGTQPTSQPYGLPFFTTDLLPTGHRYALCIGINSYRPDSGYPTLNCAVSDAKSLGAVFAALGYTTVVMTDDGNGISRDGKSDPKLVPSAANINRELLEFARNAKNPDDELVISYAGHGDVFDGQAAIIPLDYSKSANNLVTVSGILGPLNDQQCRARSKLLLLDACHSGKGDKGFLLGFANEKSLMVFSACSAGQSSVEEPAIGHGRFTEILIRGLVGQGFSAPTTQPGGDVAAGKWDGEAYVGGSEFLSATQLSEYVGRIFTQNGWSRKTPTNAGASDDNSTGQNPHMFGEQDVTVPMIVSRRQVSTPPPLTDEDRETIVETIEKAKSAYTKRNWAAVIHHATTVLRIQETNADALALRAMGNLHATYKSQAINDAQAALQADPDQAPALQVLGMCAAVNHQKPQAKSYLKSASRLIESNPKKWALIATGEDATYLHVAMAIAADDDKEAVVSLEQVANSPDVPRETLGNVAAVLGQKYHDGSSTVPKDDKKAMDYYQMSAAAGDSSAMLAAAILYEDPHGSFHDNSKALAMYKQAGRAGQEAAMFRIGEMYLYGRGVVIDNAQALFWYQKGADLGNAAAMNRVGYMWEHGLGVSEKDITKAMFWYYKAADGDDAMAMNNIGSVFENADGATHDYAKAMTWYYRAANLKCAEAMGSVGHLYDVGGGVDEDPAKAMEWYHQASDAGNAVAMFDIGNLYLKGRGVTQDYKKAMIWYVKADENDYHKAKDRIGYLYENALGVPQDYNRAVDCYNQALAAGNPHAWFSIAALYEKGVGGVAKDPKRAREWYQTAADKGDDDSKKWLAAHNAK